MMTYREVKSSSEQDFIVRTNEDGTESWIPCDPANSDYQRYLNPETEQSTSGLVNSDNPAEPVV